MESAQWFSTDKWFGCNSCGSGFLTYTLEDTYTTVKLLFRSGHERLLQMVWVQKLHKLFYQSN